MDKQAGYSEKLKQELANYQEVNAVHDLPKIYHYWSSSYLCPKLQSLGFESLDDFFLSYISRRIMAVSLATCEIVSLGAGNCDFEINIATKLKKQGNLNFHFHCLEINDAMLQRGRSSQERKALPTSFRSRNVTLTLGNRPRLSISRVS